MRFCEWNAELFFFFIMCMGDLYIQDTTQKPNKKGWDYLLVKPSLHSFNDCIWRIFLPESLDLPVKLGFSPLSIFNIKN